MMVQYKGVPLGELSPHVYAIAEQVGHSFQLSLPKEAQLPHCILQIPAACEPIARCLRSDSNPS